MDRYEQALRDVGLRLKKLRENAGYTSYENFAIQNEFSRMQYWRLENGKANLTLKSLVTILSVYDLTVEEFFEIEPSTGYPMVYTSSRAAERKRTTYKQPARKRKKQN